jgi:hypothetical protein
MPRKLRPLTEGCLFISFTLDFVDLENEGDDVRFTIAVAPETMTVQLFKGGSFSSLTEELDPNEDPQAAAKTICDAIESEGFSMDKMQPHIARLLMAIINATP